MKEAAVKVIASGPKDDCIPILIGFLEANEKVKSFPSIQMNTKKELYSALFNRIRDPTTSSELLRLILNFLRVLSREKATLEEALDKNMIDTILRVAGLKGHDEFPNCGYPEMLEGLKVIFNMVFQSPQVQQMFIDNKLLESIFSAVKNYNSIASDTPMNIRYFTFRILFIITALCQHVVPTIRNELDGLSCLNTCLEKLAQQNEPFEDQTVDVICEIEKVLYNLIHDLVPHKPDKSFIVPDEDAKRLLQTTKVVRRFLLHDCKCSEKKKELNSHSIDLLAAVTYDCFMDLVTEANASTIYKFEKYDMEAIEVIASFLHDRLENGSADRTMSEALTPVLSVLIRMAKSCRPIRKYLKIRILPPLKRADVIERPEVGSTLRNKLCALLTSPGYITELVATFLFTICKENGKRLIKYTGFGNAAGLLANRGLLLGGRGNVDEYSDDTEDSDTEEYREISSMINDVEGRIQIQHPDPFEGMTEEQKEYEAMKLVYAIDDLHRRKIIQPARIGPDGKPLAVDHICELIEQGDSAIIQSHKHDSSDSE